MVSISQGDGVRIDVPGAPTVVVDAAAPDDGLPVYTHAHGDHLYDRAPEAAICSDLTRDLAGVRRDGVPDPLDHPAVSLVPSGHVPGSRAVLVEGDRRVLHTGDCALRDRLFLDGFDPVGADVLVIESTYGIPEYSFPDPSETVAEMLTWLSETRDRPVILFGYALGRAQQLQAIVERSDRDRLFVSDAILDLNAPIERALDLSFGARSIDDLDRIGPGDALVLPSQVRSLAFVENLIEDTDALTASVSGWAVDASFRFATDYDATFVLSDHCDFEDLVGVVEQVDPSEVYTIHGSTEALASELTARGYRAQALKANQHTLGEY
ncbi:mRNA 3'-end processing factor [Halococcoides cellulosivorans]|uniref:mRNA 3'-end processing factor n=1 Tax=Halococcoides cellulosivorans TaxID=1679096 RepID=A0A2R4X0G1_9EURY|nr:mRNA 3'-end processing factor [Halococcoides cellulosivorans]AWB27280.1 mRNA 3'-end processing factor [Halococcoides cellulosivorans]